MRIVSSPQEIPCIIPAVHDGTRSESATDGMNVTVPGSYVKAIACGGRHSAVITGTDVFSLTCLVGSLECDACKHRFPFYSSCSSLLRSYSRNLRCENFLKRLKCCTYETISSNSSSKLMLLSGPF
jgi:hypothetical protein